MYKGIISVALLAALSLSVIGCADNGAADITDKNEVTVKEENTLPAGIARSEYNLTFNILYPEWGLYPNYFFGDDEKSGDVMGKALNERELKVEEYLGVDITNTPVATINDILPAVQQTSMSGDDTYQMVLTHCITAVNAMAADELVLDLNTTEINFDSDWWNHSATEALNVNGKQYYAVSDYMIPDPNCFIFNKDMIDLYDLEDPYDLVRDGKWTMDKLNEMISVVTSDNGDQVWDEKDIYGLTTGKTWYHVSFTYSAGLKLVDKDENGEFSLAFKVDDTSTKLMEKIDAIFNGPNVWTYNNNDPSDVFDISTDRCLFNMTSLNTLHTLRDTDVDFGILPFPKLTEEQDEYLSNDWSGLLCVPAAANNVDMISDTIELLSYYSDEKVIPTYYDIILGTKLSRDEDSREMLDIIFNNIVFDAGMNYFGFEKNMQKMFYVAQYAVMTPKQNNFASVYASYENGAKAEIAAFNEIMYDN